MRFFIILLLLTSCANFKFDGEKFDGKDLKSLSAREQMEFHTKEEGMAGGVLKVKVTPILSKYIHLIEKQIKKSFVDFIADYNEFNRDKTRTCFLVQIESKIEEGVKNTSFMNWRAQLALANGQKEQIWWTDNTLIRKPTKVSNVNSYRGKIPLWKNMGIGCGKKDLNFYDKNYSVELMTKSELIPFPFSEEAILAWNALESVENDEGEIITREKEGEKKQPYRGW